MLNLKPEATAWTHAVNVPKRVYRTNPIWARSLTLWMTYAQRNEPIWGPPTPPKIECSELPEQEPEWNLSAATSIQEQTHRKHRKPLQRSLPNEPNFAFIPIGENGSRPPRLPTAHLGLPTLVWSPVPEQLAADPHKCRPRYQARKLEGVMAGEGASPRHILVGTCRMPPKHCRTMRSLVASRASRTIQWPPLDSRRARTIAWRGTDK